MEYIITLLKINLNLEADPEIRSDKVRRLLGDIPRSLELWGLAVLAVIMAVIIIVLILFPSFIHTLSPI